MSLLVPKTAYSRLQLPYGVAGSSAQPEPANAMPGTLSFDPSRDVARLKTAASGWTDLLSGTIAPPSGNPYIDPPLVADPFNDEFESDSADFAVRGYTVKNAGGTTLTRAGDIDPWNAAAPASATTYLSTIIGSKIFVQVQPGVSIAVFKTVTLTAGDTYFARVGALERYDNAATTGNFMEFGLYANSAGNLDGGNRVYVSEYSSTTGPAIDLARATGGVFSTSTAQIRTPFAADIRGVRWNSGTDYRPFACESAGGSTHAFVAAGGPAGASLVFVGFNVQTFAAISGVMPAMFAIDFVRKVTGNAWIASAPRPAVWQVLNSVFGTYANKPVPSYNDTIAINDSAASGAVKNSTIAGLLHATNNMIGSALSGTPDSWNAEPSTWTNPDLAANGWSINLWNSPFTTQTRAGEIDSTSTPAPNTYRSTLLPSGQLAMQISAQVAIFKATTSASFTYRSRCWSNAGGGAGVNHELYISNNAAPLSAGARTYYIGLENANIFEALLVGPSTFTIFVNTALSGLIHPFVDNTKTINFPGSPSMSGALTLSQSGVALINPTTRGVNITPAFVGLTLAQASGTIFYIDYIRRLPYTGSFPQ